MKPKKRKLAFLDYILPLPLSFLLMMGISMFFEDNFSYSQSSKDEIETLEVIEIPGTAPTFEHHELEFPVPEIQFFSGSHSFEMPTISPEIPLRRKFQSNSLALDPIGKQRGIKSKPVPVKIERPPYPRVAKEQGWEGTVTLTLTIGPDGKVSSAAVRHSSGFPILDHIALDATKDWLFHPQKDGEFPTSAKVNIPVKFDLHEKK